MMTLKKFYGHSHDPAQLENLSGGRDGVRTVTMSANTPDFTAICDRIAAQLYAHKTNDQEIPRDLYEATAHELMDAVFSGIGRKSFTYEDPNNLLVAHLRQNVYAFSAARSLTEMKVFHDLMVDNDGKVKTPAQFRNDVAKTGAVFNKTYLETDRNTAVASAQTAQTFNSFKEDDYIQVSTTGAETVCPICGGLSGFTRQKSDAIWQELCPPFHQNCMCKLIPGLERNVAKYPNGRALLTESKVQPYFKSNPAMTKVIFEDGYPNMSELPKNKELHWQKNYNMRPLDKIYQDAWPAPLPVASKDEANAWWEKQAGTLRGEFFAKDKFGTVVKFDNKLRNHVFEQNNDGRHEYIMNALDILNDPDEVWGTKNKKGELITTFIKYYNDFPYTVRVNDTRVFTIYRFDENGKANQDSFYGKRAGELLFRND